MNFSRSPYQICTLRTLSITILFALSMLPAMAQLCHLDFENDDEDAFGHATDDPGAVYVAGGPIGYYADLNGVRSVEIYDVEEKSEITISTWVKTWAPDGSGYKYLVSNTVDNDNSGIKIFFYGYKIYVKVGDATYTSVADICFDKNRERHGEGYVWDHYSVVISKNPWNVQLYLNGEAKDISLSSGSLPTDLSLGGNFYLGKASGAENPSLYGFIDEFHIHDCILSESDVASIMAGTSVTCTPPIDVQTVNITETSIPLDAGVTETLNVTVLPADASNPTLNWTSSNEAVATVNGSGQVTAIAAGNTTITATSTDGTNISDQCVVTVSLPNLALHKPATISSTISGGDVSKAFDGNTDGNFTNGSVAHTDITLSLQEYIQVDLGEICNINRIEIWNRTDNDADILQKFYLFISNDPLPPNPSISHILNEPRNWMYHYDGAYPNPNVSITANSTGRYVRIHTQNSHYLHIAEMQVFGTPGATPPSNNPPEITLSPSQNLSAGTTSCTLSAAVTDPDGTTPGIQWTELSSHGTSIANSNQATAEASGLSNGNTYIYQVSASDGQATTTANCTVTVASAGVNNPPQITLSSSSLSYQAGTTTCPLEASVRDDDGDPLTISWTETSSHGASIANSSLAIASASGLSDGNTYTFQIRASDGTATTTDELSVTIAGATSGGTTSSLWTETAEGGISYKKNINLKGFVGIATDNPLSRLHVKNWSNDGMVGELLYLEGGGVNLRTRSWIPGNHPSMPDRSIFFEISNDNGVSWINNLTLDEDGNVGIGTRRPTTKLTVKGTTKTTRLEVTDNIIAEGLIETGNLRLYKEVPNSDHVFEKDYPLMTLSELESFIHSNKHLPEVPSAQEFSEEGYSVGQMDDLLLRKIEELTLYILELEERLKAVEQQ